MASLPLSPEIAREGRRSNRPVPPFAKLPAWMSEQGFATAPVEAYGVVLLLAGVAYSILQRVLIRTEGPGSPLAAAVGRDLKGKVSGPIYAVGILLTIVHPALGLALYVLAAVLWFLPDRRVERQLARQAETVDHADAAG